MDAPALEVLIQSPYRLVLGVRDASYTAVGATVEVSSSSAFSSPTTMVATTAGPWEFTYLYPANGWQTTLYARAKVSDGSADSAWSTTATATALSAPATPTLADVGGVPQAISVGVSNVPGGSAPISYTFQISRSISFATVDKEVVVESGPARVEYRVPAAYRRTTYYLRAKASRLYDFAEGADYGLESGWSATLEVPGAGQVGDADISSVAVSKVTGRSSAAISNGSQVALGTPFGTTPAGLSQDPDLQASLVSGNTYRFSLVAVVGYNAATDLRFALDLPSVDATGTYYTGRWGQAAYNTTALTASSTLGSPTFYTGKSTTGTISLVASGSSSTSYFVAYLEFSGRLTATSDGVLALSYGPDSATTAVILPWLLHGHLEIENVSTTGSL